MAGGATRLPCTDRAANSASVYTGFASPIASTQLLIIGRFTGSRAGCAADSPAAATRAAAALIAASVAAETVSAERSLAAVILTPPRLPYFPLACGAPLRHRLPSSLAPSSLAPQSRRRRAPPARSSWHPRQAEPGARDELPLDLVDPAAERQHGVALDLDVEPAHQLGGLGVGRVAVPADDLLEELAEPLQPYRAEHLRGGRVGDVHRRRDRDLPVEQLVDPQAGAGLGQPAPHIRLAQQRAAVRPAAAGGPAAYPVVQGRDPARRAEHDPLVVELRGHQPPAGVLLPDPHRYGDSDVGVVRRVEVVRAVVGDDRGPGVAGIGRVDDQDGDPPVPRRVGVGAAGQPDVVGVVAAGGEDLLAVDHVG